MQTLQFVLGGHLMEQLSELLGVLLPPLLQVHHSPQAHQVNHPLEQQYQLSTLSGVGPHINSLGGVDLVLVGNVGEDHHLPDPDGRLGGSKTTDNKLLNSAWPDL